MGVSSAGKFLLRLTKTFVFVCSLCELHWDVFRDRSHPVGNTKGHFLISVFLISLYFLIYCILDDTRDNNEKESLFLKATQLSFLSKFIIWFLCHKKQFIIVQMVLMSLLEHYDFTEE